MLLLLVKIQSFMSGAVVSCQTEYSCLYRDKIVVGTPQIMDNCICPKSSFPQAVWIIIYERDGQESRKKSFPKSIPWGISRS